MAKIKQIEGLQAALNDKVDKVTGKGLSTNDYTNDEKNKLTGIEEAAQRNAVDSVAGKTGAVTLVKADVGLGNVANEAQVKKASSSTTGKLPKWNVDTGDEIVDGYGVRTEIRAFGTAGDDDLPTEKAVRVAINSALASADAMTYKGAIDASVNPDYPAADAGDTWKISDAGRVGGASGTKVGVGDILICIEDNTPAGSQAGVGDKWNVIHVNREGEVIGPEGATNNHIAVFDGSSGALIKDGGTTIADIQAGATNQRQDEITGQEASANTELTITAGLNATPLSGTEPVLTINGLVVQRGNYASLDTEKWAFSGQNIKLKMPYAIETDDLILVKYNY
jgi:hypothetical protein